MKTFCDVFGFYDNLQKADPNYEYEAQNDHSVSPI